MVFDEGSSSTEEKLSVVLLSLIGKGSRPKEQ